MHGIIVLYDTAVVQRASTIIIHVDHTASIKSINSKMVTAAAAAAAAAVV